MKVLVLFFFSGATGLVYEVIWSKYLSLLLGSTAQAQAVVVATFMGGLALGNKIFGARADILRRPLSTYGLLELVVGLWGFWFPQLYSAIDKVFVLAGSGLLGTVWLFPLKAVLSVVLLLPPTILMGGTLPLLASWLENHNSSNRRKTAGKNIGTFYAINSFGAVAGSALAGFYLERRLGLPITLELTALVNLVIGVAALAFGRAEEPFPLKSTLPPEKVEPSNPIGNIRWLSCLVAITGGVSMSLEILASRSIGMIVGASLQAFAIVLIAFILGISFGSMIASASGLAFRRPRETVYGLLIGAGALVGVYVLCIQYWVVLYSQIRFGLAMNQSGYVLHQIIAGLISVMVLGLPAALLGAVLPLCMRLAAAEGGLTAQKVGRLLTWNTLGAVLGVVITGFILMPSIGLRSTLALISLLLLAGVAFAAQRESAWFAKGAVLGTAALLVLFLSTGNGWREILGSGVFRIRDRALDFDIIENARKNSNLLFYKDGPDANVYVEQANNLEDPQIFLKINGKTDASTHSDLSTQYLLAHLPMMARPASKEIFVFGFGSGITAGAFLGHPVDRITIAENCGPVLDAAKFFTRWNHGVLTNSRTRILKEDARTALKLSANKYDVIVSEPSNPWVAGVGSVFSEEFYEIAAEHLKDGGIMAQWFHIYEMSDPIVFMVLRTFVHTFPNLEIWDSQTGDLVLLGSKKAWDSKPSIYQKIFERPQPKKDLEEIGILTAVQVWARQIASQQTAFAIPGVGQIQSDEYPVLEYAAPEAFFVGGRAQEIFSYDERVFQYMVAPADKEAVVRAIPEPAILKMFQTFDSCSPALDKFFAERAAEQQRNTPDVHNEESLFPTMFRSHSSYPKKPPALLNMSSAQQDVLEHYLDLLADRGPWEEHARAIVKSLRAMLADPSLRPSNDFNPAFHAATVAKFYLAHGRFPDAMAAVQLGANFDRADRQLGYVQRLADGWAESLLDGQTVPTNAYLRLVMPRSK